VPAFYREESKRALIFANADQRERFDSVRHIAKSFSTPYDYLAVKRLGKRHPVGVSLGAFQAVRASTDIG
jgi:hypothetical protein